jgi:hypothetical protein
LPDSLPRSSTNEFGARSSNPRPTASPLWGIQPRTASDRPSAGAWTLLCRFDHDRSKRPSVSTCVV